LSDSQTLYLFPHTIFRLDPDLDHILVAILKQDPRAHLVLLRYRETSLHEYIQQRLAPQLSAAEQKRITWLPWLPQNHFLQLLTLADIALDGLYLGGGLVTYQCFAMGLPIVHVPSNQLRCRIAAALYQIAGLEEWIARDRQDYLDKALKLGTQPLLRQQLKAAIRAAYPRLFENQQGLEELADFFIGQFKEKNHAIHTP
jgi:predicted O-linked N-acetylglucosamine transferase (SPINDLY family)